jgi:hypothetical protein
MLDLRIYRAAFVPALLALVVAAFSLQDRPDPVRGGRLATDAFDAESTLAATRQLAARFPDRRAGSPADGALADVVEQRFRRMRSFAVRRTVTSGRTIDGTRDLVTVTATRVGSSPRRIVVLAHRDALTAPSEAEMSGTASLLELGRIFAGRFARKTLVLVSTSAGASTDAGAAAWAERVAGGPVDGVLVVGDLTGAVRHEPTVVPWSQSEGAAPLRLQRTVQAAVRREAGDDPGGYRALAQLGRLAFPITLSEQGVLVEHGLPGVLLQASGERGPQGAGAGEAPALEAFGRSALRVITALDAAAPQQEPLQDGLVLRGQLLPRWAARLLGATLLLPLLAVAVDAFARARRRHRPVGAHLRRIALIAVPLLLGALLAWLLELTGAIPGARPAPVAPPEAPLDGAAWAAMGASAALALGSWLAVRPWRRRIAAEAPLEDPTVAAALGLTFAAIGIAVWLVNPWALLVLVPALHLLTLGASPELPARTGVLAGVLAGALLVPLVVWASLAHGLRLGPLESLWTGYLAVAGRHVGPVAQLVWCVLLAAGLVAVASMVVRVRARRGATAPEIRTRGPRSYAGPGSLGGTDSAMRR